MSIVSGLFVSSKEGFVTSSLNRLADLVGVTSFGSVSVKEGFFKNKGVRDATGDPSGLASPGSSKLRFPFSSKSFVDGLDSI